MGRAAGWAALLLAVGVAGSARGEDSLAALATRYLEGADVVPEFAQWTTARVDTEDHRAWRRFGAGDRRACGAVLLLCEALQRGSGSTRPTHRAAILDLVHGLLKQPPAREGCGLGQDAARRLTLLAEAGESDERLLVLLAGGRDILDEVLPGPHPDHLPSCWNRHSHPASLLSSEDRW